MDCFTHDDEGDDRALREIARTTDTSSRPVAGVGGNVRAGHQHRVPCYERDDRVKLIKITWKCMLSRSICPPDVAYV